MTNFRIKASAMPHALIIDTNMIVSRAVQSCLEDLGFSTFDHTWTERQALEAARQRAPDLIVIGDEVASGSALSAARKIAQGLSVPVLMISGDPSRAHHSLSQVASFDGPFLLNEIDQAVELARSQNAPAGNARTRQPQEWRLPQG